MKTRIGSLHVALSLLMLTAFAYNCEAQLLKQIGEKVKNTATDHVVNDAGNATDKAIDNAEDKAVNGKNGKAKSATEASGDKSDHGGSGSENSNGVPSLHTYQNYDFVPGDTIIFSDDLEEDQEGEFPAHWNLSKGQAVVNTIDGKPTFCFTDGNYCHVTPRMKSASYLTDPFTIEFDTYTDGNGDESPILFLEYTNGEGTQEEGEITFNRGDDEGRGDVTTSYFPESGNFTAQLPSALIEDYTGKWHHCAIIYKAGQLKCYVDQYRILVVPTLGCVPTAFGLEGIGDQEHPVMVTNVRAASGGNMNTVGKKFTDAKLVTHGINFDVDKATIRPESMGTLNMIVKVLNNNPDLKFEIDGHTDNTGTSAHNLTLSKQRADAVEAQLEKMGISASRLSTKGFGDTKPLGANDTPEGRANNRRVEFVRM